MAKVHFSAAISEMRNKLGGSVYARNRYGAYVRNYVATIPPNTVYQLDMQAVFALVSGSWKTITGNQRELWRQATLRVVRKDVFGKQSYLTGAQYFNKLNIDFYLANTALLYEPPILREMPLFSGLQVSLNVAMSELFIDLSENNLTNEYVLNVRATSAQSQGAIFFKNKYYSIGMIMDASALPVNMYIDYIAKYVGFVSGTRVGIQVYAIDSLTGLRSSPLNTYVDVP